MTLAPATGYETWGSCFDAVAMPCTRCGTSESQPSSCPESSSPLSVYQDPAWVALRLIVMFGLVFVQWRGRVVVLAFTNEGQMESMISVDLSLHIESDKLIDI